MKTGYAFGWILFFGGVAFQFLQWPFTAILLLAGSFVLLITSLLLFYRQRNERPAVSMILVSLALMSLYCTGRLHFWFFSKLLFPVLCIITVLSLIYYLVVFRKVSLSWIILLTSFIFTIWFSYVPSYRLYYAIRLNTMLNKESRLYDYRSWDKYSWFLYIRDMHSEALDANRQAREAVDRVISEGPDERAKKFKKLVEQHEYQIVHEHWESYP